MDRENLLIGIFFTVLGALIFFGGFICGDYHTINKIEERVKNLGYYQINFKDNTIEIRKNVYVVENGKMISLKQFLEYVSTGKTKEDMIIKEFKFWNNPEDNDWKTIKEK